MPGRLDRYLMREALAAMLAVSGVLWLAMMANVGVQLFGVVTSGALPVHVVSPLLWANGVKLVMFILPVGGFLGLLLALGRLYKDQEIPVLIACGATPLRLMRPLLWILLPWSFVVGWLALVQWPATQFERDELLQQVRSASMYDRLPVGRFIIADKGRVTVYAERLGRDGRTLEGVFVYTRQDGMEGVERARFASFEIDAQGYRQLVLRDGVRYDGAMGRADWREVSYAEHRIDLGLERSESVAQRKRATLSWDNLLASDQPADLAELAKRLAQPLSALLLGLMALPLARVSPRQGRFARLGAGVLIYIIYFNLIHLANRMIQNGTLDPLAGVLAPHLIALALVVVLFHRLGAFRRTPPVPSGPGAIA